MSPSQETFFSSFHRQSQFAKNLDTLSETRCPGTMPYYVSARSVLDYLRDMVELCRRLHRSDLERDYLDAWENVALAIYGKFPPRNWKPSFQYQAPEPRKKTVGQIESLASPSRRIIGRDGDHEILECGHRRFHVEYSGSPSPKRRRCKDCFYIDSATLRGSQYQEP